MSGDRTETFGAFELRRLLGRGGMGEVWLAFDPMLERDVALKLLGEDSSLEESSEQWLVREARAASALDHPGIVTVHQLGRERGRMFIAMEYVAGRSLGRILKDQGSLPKDRVADLVEQAAAALGTAHEAGLVHRDVKPENIVVRDDGRAKVLDFGLAHAAQRRGGQAPQAAPAAPVRAAGSPAPRAGSEPLAFDETDHAGAVQGAAQTQLVGDATGPQATAGAGTPLYMAPEQVDGRPPTAAADQFALAATAYELLLGEPLRRGSTVAEVLYAPVDWPQRRKEGRLPDEVLDVLARATATRPEDRYPGITDFARALRAALLPEQDEEVRARAPRGGGRLRLLFGAAALAAAAGLALFFTSRGESSAQEPEELKMAVVPGNKVLFTRLYAPIAEDLTEARGAPVRAVIASSYEDTVEGVVTGRYQLAFLPPSAYVAARRRLPELELLGGRGYGGDIRYRSLLIGRRGGAVTDDPESLRGKTVCFVDPKSTSGYRVPHAMLGERGLKEGRDFEAVFSGDHYNALEELAGGRCEVSAVSSLQFADAPRQGLVTDQFVILMRSDPLPPIAFVAHPRVRPATRNALRAGLRRALEHSRQRSGSLPSEESGKLVEVDDDDYDLVRKLPP